MIQGHTTSDHGPSVCKVNTFTFYSLLLVLSESFQGHAEFVPLVISSPHSNQVTIPRNLLLTISICEILTCFDLRTKDFV